MDKFKAWAQNMSDIIAAKNLQYLSGDFEWKKCLQTVFDISTVQTEPSYPAINRPFTNGVGFNQMKTGIGFYYIPYRNPTDKEVYYQEYSIPRQNSFKEYLNNMKGSGPTSFVELAEFLLRQTNNPAAPPPILLKRIGRMFDEKTGNWLADNRHVDILPNISWGTSVVTDVPQGYLCVGDTYHLNGNQSNNQLIMYAHHSICFTGARPWFRKQIKGTYNLPFWDLEYDRLSHEIRALYTNPYLNLMGRPYPVMILRAFFEYSPEKKLFFTDTVMGNFHLTTAIKGFSGIMDIYNNVRVDDWIYFGSESGHEFERLRVEVAKRFGQYRNDKYPGIENDSNRKYLQLDYNEALNNILGAVANPFNDINQTMFMGLSKDGVLQHRYMRPFVKQLCHPAKFRPNEIKYTLPEEFPHLCACVGRDGSIDEINNNNKSYRPSDSLPLRQHCVDKHCNIDKTGVYRWYDNTCEPEIFCTESVGTRAVVDLSLRNIIFDENNPKCQLGSAPTTTTTTTTTTNTTRPANTTPPPSTTTTTPTITSALPSSFFTMDMTNPVNYNNMKMTEDSLYVPFIPSTAYGIPIDQLLFIPAIPKDNARTAMFESMADLPSLEGTGPTTWGEIGSTLVRLHASKTPLFLTRKLSSTPDEPNLPNYSYANGTSWVPKNYIPVGDCANLQTERNRNSLVLYAHKDICNTTYAMKYSDFVRYADSENGNQTINAMYIMMGYRYWAGWNKSVMVLRSALQFSDDGALYFDYVWEGKGSVIARATSQRGDAKQFYYANTTGITEWGNHTNSFIPLAFPLHALQHLASLATRPTQDIKDGIFQGFIKGDTNTPNYDILTLVMRGDSARGASGLCHPKAFRADEYPILPYILGFPDVCACIGTNGAEDNLNKALENYKSDRTTRIKLKCTNQTCQDFDKDVYRFPDDCPDVQLCIQDVSVKTKVGDLLAENSKVSISDVKQTCNFGGSSSSSTPSSTPASTPSEKARENSSNSSEGGGSSPGRTAAQPATNLASTLTPTTNDTASDMNVGALVGGIVGGLMLLLFLGLIIAIFINWFKNRRPQAPPVSQNK